jgi:hypothetical protein
MNYFTHAVRFLGDPDPYFIAGTGVPDWLTVADRQVRIRRRHLAAKLFDVDRQTAALARGIQQHFDDDASFHESRAFAELSLALSAEARDALAEPHGLRPAFLGHVLVEMLLDASLIAENPARLAEYYRLLESIDPGRVQEEVNRMAPQPTDRLAWLIREFCRDRILWDYLDDEKLLRRLSQVMRRVGLSELPDDFVALLPAARHLVDRRKAELLGPPDTLSSRRHRRCVSE